MIEVASHRTWSAMSCSASMSSAGDECVVWVLTVHRLSMPKSELGAKAKAHHVLEQVVLVQPCVDLLGHGVEQVVFSLEVVRHARQLVVFPVVVGDVGDEVMHVNRRHGFVGGAVQDEDGYRHTSQIVGASVSVSQAPLAEPRPKGAEMRQRRRQ